MLGVSGLHEAERGEWDEYPDTGIADPEFPLEQRLSVPSLLGTYGKMVVYPFAQMARDVGKYRRRSVNRTATS